MKYLLLLLSISLSLSIQAQTSTRPKAPVKKTTEKAPPPVIEPTAGNEVIVAPEPIGGDTVTYTGIDPALDSVARLEGADFGMAPAVAKEFTLSSFIYKAVKAVGKTIGETCEEGYSYYLVTVDENGFVANVKSLKLDPNSECAKLVMKAIYQSSGKWSPAVKQGKKVRNRFTFRFQV